MKKISSKIILSLLLAVVLWGGVGGTSFNNIDFVNIVLAQSSSSEIKAPSNAYLWLLETTETTLQFLAYPITGPARALENTYNWFTGGIGDWIKDGALWVTIQLLYITLVIVNFFVATAGTIFDQSLNFSIYSINSSSEIRSSIEYTWSFLRNFINVTYIFVLLWISIKTIVGLDSANTKKLLARVIISALLINFSLFATRIVIDAGNITAINLATSGMVSDKAKTAGYSQSLISATKISTMYAQGDKPNQSEVQMDTLIDLATKIALGVIVIWVFISVALLFVIRAVILTFLMIFSPIGFVGEIIPYLKSYSQKWWNTLFDQALVAPVFFLFMFLIIKLSETGEISNIGKFFNFAVIVVFLITSVKITKKLSGEAGAALSKLGAGAIGLGIGLATGGTALALRRTVGKGALNMANNQDLIDRAAKGDIGARMLLATTRRVSNSSFDIRNTKVGSLTKKVGVDINQGTSVQKGGFVKTKEEAEKRAAEEVKFYGNTKASDAETLAELDVAANKRSEAARLRNQASRTQAEEARLQELNDDIKAHEERFKGIENATDKLEFAKSVIEKEKKAKRLQDLADRESRDVINKIKGTDKIKSDKIRKSIKEKTEEEKFIESAQKLAEKQQKTQTTSNQNQSQNQTPPPPPPNNNTGPGANPTP